MPANLTADYIDAEKKYRAAKTSDEKLGFLELMLSTIPKHKGTDRLQADIKKKIKQMKEKIVDGKKSGKKGPSYKVEREGAGQIFLLGKPNSGKSELASALSGVHCEAADFPFTTKVCQPVMMQFENIKIQLVDSPAVSEEYMEPWFLSIARNGDLALVILDAGSESCVADMDDVIKICSKSRVELFHHCLPVEKKVGNAYMKAMVLVNKLDEPGAEERLSEIQEKYKSLFPILSASVIDDESLENLRPELFKSLEIIRAYTKKPGKQADMNDPVILPQGSTVLDFAISIHKELGMNLKHAKIWGEGKYDGQMVNRDYALVDGDVLEIKT